MRLPVLPDGLRKTRGAIASRGRREKGKTFIGKKITSKGTVTKVDVNNPGAAAIHLENGIHCDLGKFKEMAESTSPGDIVFVDGFLKRCTEGDVLLEPAMLRDPNARFSSKR